MITLKCFSKICQSGLDLDPCQTTEATSATLALHKSVRDLAAFCAARNVFLWLPWVAQYEHFLMIFYFSVPLAGPRASRGLPEVLQEQSSHSRRHKARDAANEPIQGEVRQCASCMINSIPERWREYVYPRTSDCLFNMKICCQML